MEKQPQALTTSSPALLFPPILIIESNSAEIWKLQFKFNKHLSVRLASGKVVGRMMKLIQVCVGSREVNTVQCEKL